MEENLRARRKVKTATDGITERRVRGVFHYVPLRLIPALSDALD